ncbi:MAG: DUF6913 domain-containing protein [Bacteroidota bacterium]
MLWIKQKMLALYTRRTIQTDRVVRANVGFQQAQHVGILYSADSSKKHKTVNQFVNQLKAMGKNVSVLCYTTVPVQQAANTYATITHRDLQLWGTITHPKAKAFINTPFDYLFQVDMVGHAAMDYLIAKSQAKCRVGYYDTARTNLFEMMVTFDEHRKSDTIDTLTTQMIHYAKLLNVQ